MKHWINYLCLWMVIGTHAQSPITLTDPSGQVHLRFELNDKGAPIYAVQYQNKAVITPSGLGLQRKNLPALREGFVWITDSSRQVRESWKPVLGQYERIDNHYNETVVYLQQTQTQITMVLRFRAYREGIAFRYEFPKQKALDYFVISDELTEFNLTAPHQAFWIPGDFDTNEYAYQACTLDQVPFAANEGNNGIGFKGPRQANRVQSPLQLKSADGLYINIFEAAVINYPVMHLGISNNGRSLQSQLVPNALGDKAYVQAPMHTPWRTVMVSRDARDIVGSNLILNLNDPCALTDTSWIKPMKYVGIWWEMHIGKSTWDYAGSQNAQNNGLLKASGRHGATTDNAKRYIDFAARHGFQGVLIEGWNVGWEDWFGHWKEDVFDFTTPYPDFSLDEVSRYAASKNIQLIMHHETSGSVSNYERWLDRALALTQKYGYKAIKTGYVGPIIPRGEWHDGQSMVNHYLHVVKRAAEYQLMVNSHESSRPTGVHRTYPNYVAAEAARGNEFNAWSVGNPPAHETILPFTRLLGGPMDYTPGIFEIQMSAYQAGKKEQVHTTLAKQLALYVTLYSPIQMAADLPENYEKYPDAFTFIKHVPCQWRDTRVLWAEPNDYVAIARLDAHSSNWYVGAITDEEARTFECTFDFLPKNQTFEAVIYEDAPDAHWQNNPKAYRIRNIKVNRSTRLSLPLAPGGGVAIELIAPKA